MRRHRRNLGRKDPWEEEMATTPVLLPGKSHGQGSLAGYSPWGLKDLDTAELGCMCVWNQNSLASISCLLVFKFTDLKFKMPYGRYIYTHTCVCIYICVCMCVCIYISNHHIVPFELCNYICQLFIGKLEKYESVKNLM